MVIKKKSKRNLGVRIEDLYTEFETWYEEYYSGNKSVSKAEFIEYLKKKYGKNVVKHGKINGYMFLLDKLNEDRANNNDNDYDQQEDDESSSNKHSSQQNQEQQQQHLFGNFISNSSNTNTTGTI